MRPTLLALLAPLFVATLVVADCTPITLSTHRRHHAKHHRKIAKSVNNLNATTASTAPILNAPAHTHAHTKGSKSAATTSTAAKSAATAASSSGKKSGHSVGNAPLINNLAVGFLPDDGSGGGQAQSMSQIVSSLGINAQPLQGWYAQAHSGTPFDGSQLLSRMDQIVAAGGVFQPAIMPTGGWQGLTSSDNSQAVAICKVLKQFTDKGLTVWLRFAHEVNYYQTDGTYSGGVADFKEGWSTVAAACKSIAPEVKMWFTPNVANDAQYDEYYPDDPSTVDYIGIDYYPSQPGNFVNRMKSFHDKYTTSNGPYFAIGETGLGVSADISTRLAWFKEITSAETASALPNFKAVSWFNYDKGYEFSIAATSGDQITAAYFANNGA